MTTATLEAGAQERNDYEDDEKIRLLFDRCRNDAKGNMARQARDHQDIHNLMLYRGGEDNHWSALNTYTGRYEPIPYDGEDGIPPWVTRCVTNKFARKIDSITAILNQSVPAKLFVPMTNDDEDLAAAEVAEDADPVLLEEIGYERLKRRAHQLITLTDKCAYVVFYDNDPKHGELEIELMQCLDCGEYTTPMETGGTPVEEMKAREAEDEFAQPDAVCPSCGSENVTIATDPRTGQVIGEPYPIGKMCCDLWCSYEFSLPSTAVVPDADENEWVLGHRSMSVDRACSDWPDFADEIRKQVGGAGSVQAPTAQQYAEQMRGLSSPRASMGATGLNSRNTVTVYRLQHDCIDDDEVSFPQGLHAVMVGDAIVMKRELPLVNAQGAYRKSILIRTYGDTPNTPFGKPPADDLNPLQRMRNKFESLIYLTLMLHGAPQVFIPDSVELVDEMTGEPWKPMRYKTSVPGAKPSIERGVNPAESLYKSIEMIDAAMEDVSGLNSVLGGSRPEGDPTLGEVQILQERGMQSFRTPLDHLIDSERRLSLMLLDLARQTAWAPRFRKVEGEDGRWKVSQFTAADLQGAVDITIDPLTAWPKSPSMELVRLQKAVEMGVLIPQQDPEVATKILATLGLTHFKPSLKEDRGQVARALDRWKAAVSPMEIEPPDLFVIEKAFHLHLKRQFLKTEMAEDIKRANPPVYQAMVAHVQMIEMALMPPPAPDPNAKPAGPDGAAVQGAVDAGAIVPAGAIPPQAPPDVLGDAVNSGALLPAGAVPQGPTGPSIDQLLEDGVMTPAPPQVVPGAAPPS